MSADEKSHLMYPRGTCFCGYLVLRMLCPAVASSVRLTRNLFVLNTFRGKKLVLIFLGSGFSLYCEC